MTSFEMLSRHDSRFHRIGERAMPFKAYTDGAKVFIEFKNIYGTWGNVLWFRKPNFNLADLQQLATTVKQVAVDHLVDRMVVGTSCNRTIGYDMRTADGATVVGDYIGGTGDGAGGPLPIGDACVLTLRTDKRGRSYRGRVFISGLAEADCLDSKVSPAAIADIEAWGNALKAEVLTHGWEWCVASAQLDGVERPVGVLTPIESVEVRNDTFASQRRRDKRA